MKYKKKELYKTEAVQLAAVKRYGFAIKYIKNPTEAVFDYLYKTDRRAFDDYCEVIDHD
jgi:hypothetical protein